MSADEIDETCLEVGFPVALRVRKGTAPSRCYVGRVVAVDGHGVRITLANFLIGAFVGFDVFVPWVNIECAYVAPDDYTPSEGELGAWQTSLMGEDEPDE